jgi:hypothetical protein
MFFEGFRYPEIATVSVHRPWVRLRVGGFLPNLAL